MEQHRQFDYAIEQYEIFNRGTYDKRKHVEHVRAVVVRGQQLLRELGEPPTTSASLSVIMEANVWALQHFEAIDRANAAVHCAPVRYSPITFRLARALRELWPPSDEFTQAMTNVLQHDGVYEEDPGR